MIEGQGFILNRGIDDKKVQKVPPKEVQETLMTSYEGLEPMQ